MVNEALWHSAPLQHNRLLQLINSVELLAVLDLLLAPKLRNPPDLNPGYWGHVSGSTKATFSRRRYAIVFFAQSTMARRSAALDSRGDLRRLALSSDNISIVTLVALCSLYTLAEYH